MGRKGLLVFVIVLLIIFSVSCAQPGKKPQAPEPEKEEPVITLYVAETGQVKEIALEEYLYGVVAAEMEVDWPVEALAAQAILARTFTLEK